MLKILKYPDPRLNQEAIPVTKFDADLKLIVDQMLTTMYHQEGVGLASIQVNIQKSIFVMDISENGDDPKVFINPVIIKTSGSQTDTEGCLSFPHLRIKVTRPQNLTVKAQDINGKEFEVEASDFKARCIHHECEHLAGEVFIKDLSRLKLNIALKKLEKAKNN